MSEKEFNKRWDKQINKLVEKAGGSCNRDELSQFSLPECLWKFNQIIGYIIISSTKNEIIFNLYCSTDKKYFADSKKKHWMINWDMNGTHFETNSKSEYEIKTEICKWLKIIYKEHLHSKHFIDLSTFNNIINYIDIKKMMKTL